MNTVIPLGVKEAKDVGSVADVIAMLADAAGGDAKIIISRHEGGKIAYCETVQLATIEAEGLDYVQRKYGGGEYRMQLHAKEDGGNRAAIRRGYDVKIANIPTPPAPAPSPVWQPAPATTTWDGDKIIAVLTAAAPLVRTAAEWWSARQQQVMTPYNNPVQGGGGLAALSETLMSLQIMGQLKETVGDVFGSVASSDSGDKRSALLNALTPALGMLMQQPTPAQAPAPTPENVSRETMEEEEMSEPNQYEAVLTLIAESIRSGNQDTVIALLEECDPTVSAQILSANGMQIAMFAGRFALSVAVVRESLANAKEVLNAPKSV